MSNEYVLLLFQVGDFKGALVCTPNPAPNPGIWYYDLGTAKPPLPFPSAQQGSFQQVLGPSVLVSNTGGDLLATVWDLNYTTAKPGDTGSVAIPGISLNWEFETVQGGTGALYRHAGDLAIRLAGS